MLKLMIVLALQISPHTLEGQIQENNATRLSANEIVAAEQRRVNAVVLSGTDVFVEWKGPKEDVDAFIIERRSLAEPRWTRVGRVDGSVRRIRSSGLTPNSAYDYRVLARVGDRISIIDAPVSVTTDDPTNPRTSSLMVLKSSGITVRSIFRMPWPRCESLRLTPAPAGFPLKAGI